MSAIGPYVSTDTVTVTKLSMPIAAMATPYRPAVIFAAIIATPRMITGPITEIMPTLIPSVMVRAAPSALLAAIFCVGLKS